jgi:geranylgeranyl pyrophosphate synthase
LRDGNPSLPIILALDDAIVREVFEQTEFDEGRIAEALAAIKRGPAISRTKELSRHYAETALSSLKRLPPSPYRNCLKSLVKLIIDRDF